MTDEKRLEEIREWCTGENIEYAVEDFNDREKLMLKWLRWLLTHIEFLKKRLEEREIIVSNRQHEIESLNQWQDNVEADRDFWQDLYDNIVKHLKSLKAENKKLIEVATDNHDSYEAKRAEVKSLKKERDRWGKEAHTWITEATNLREQLASAERVIEAAREAIRWATGTDKHWKAEGILSALVEEYDEQYHGSERQEDSRHQEAHPESRKRSNGNTT